jgi:membrane-bound ClpP family serine protease
MFIRLFGTMIRANVETDLFWRRRPVMALAALAGVLFFSCLGEVVAANEGPSGKQIQPAAAPEAPKQLAFSIRLPLPITDQAANRVKQFVSKALEKAQAQNVKPYLIFEFFIPPGQENFAKASNFGACYELANYLTGEDLNAAKTVAYLPQSIQGHAILAVMACDDIIMAPDASIGPAGVDKSQISETVRAAYREIAGRRRKLTVPLALGLLDPSLEILSVQTEVGTEYVTPEGLVELKKTQAAATPEVFKPAGEPLQLTGKKARDLGFVTYLAANRRDLVQALDLAPLAIEDDPSLENPWKAVRIDLKGPVTSDKVRQVQKMIEDQTSLHDVNFICLWIESPGGSPADTGVLVNFLLSLNPSQVRTVAYIPKEARSDAALIVLACDQVVMHPKAVLGGPGALEITKDEVALLRQLIRQTLAPHKGRSWSLMAALIDPDLEVYQCTHLGEVEYFSSEELAEQPNPAQWEKGQKISLHNVPLKLDGNQALQMRLANALTANFGEFKQHYGLENEPALVEPGWADKLIEALSSRGVAILLLFIGAAGLYFEFHTPGLGLGAFVALVCFMLFLWSQFLNGAPGWLISILFLSGVACILLEIFVIPGFGIFALGGGIMVILSLVLASQILVMPRSSQQVAEMQRSLLIIGGATAALFAAALLSRKWLPHAPILSHMILSPPEAEERETISRRELLVDLHELVGTQGVTSTPLMPAGKARFGDAVIDVIADGDMIDPGKTVEVVEVRGNRVVVREIIS